MEVVHIGARDPGSDLKLVAVLPNTGIAASLERAVLPSGEPLTAVQASHVGSYTTWRGGSSSGRVVGIGTNGRTNHLSWINDKHKVAKVPMHCR